MSLYMTFYNALCPVCKKELDCGKFITSGHLKCSNAVRPWVCNEPGNDDLPLLDIRENGEPCRLFGYHALGCACCSREHLDAVENHLAKPNGFYFSGCCGEWSEEIGMMAEVRRSSTDYRFVRIV